MAHDPVEHRFRPDQELVELAQRRMLEDETPRTRYVRQRWEEAFGAVKVALAALREIWPIERSVIDEFSRVEFEVSLEQVQKAYESLDAVAEAMLGSRMYEVLQGSITSPDQLDTQSPPR